MINRSNVSLIVVNASDQCTLTNVILLRYVGTLIFFIGIVSTLLSIGVFTRRALRRKSCCFYFLILAISDAIHLLTMTLENLPYSFRLDVIVIHSLICKVIIFLIYFSNHFSNWILTLASIDRLVLIYCPSRSKWYCQVDKAKKLVLVLCLILLLSNGHILYGYERLSVGPPEFAPSYDCNIHPGNVFYNRWFHFYDSYLESVCFVVIPFIVMSLCSILIIVQIVKSRRTVQIRQSVDTRRRRRSFTPLREKDIQLSLMLIGTSFAFLLLCLPAELNDLFNSLSPERSCSHWFRKVLLTLMQQIYYAGHFYIYTLTGQVFREHLKAMICRKSTERTQLG